MREGCGVREGCGARDGCGAREGTASATDEAHARARCWRVLVSGKHATQCAPRGPRAPKVGVSRRRMRSAPGRVAEHPNRRASIICITGHIADGIWDAPGWGPERLAGCL